MKNIIANDSNQSIIIEQRQKLGKNAHGIGYISCNDYLQNYQNLPGQILSTALLQNSRRKENNSKQAGAELCQAKLS